MSLESSSTDSHARASAVLQDSRIRARSDSALQEVTDELSSTEGATTSIAELALQVFGDSAHAEVWLSKPNERFGNRTPAELLRTAAGRHEVEEMLGQIDNGMFA